MGGTYGWSTKGAAREEASTSCIEKGTGIL